MAKSFTFRLQPLLTIRERAEEARKQALARVLGKLNEQTDRARRYDGMIRSEHQSMRAGRLVGEIDPRYLAHHRRYVNSVMKAMVETLCERAGTVQQADAARVQLIEAAKQRKVLEKLRDRRADQYRRHVDRIEENELGEMGIVASRRLREVAQ